MSDARDTISRRLADHFEGVWRAGDAWDLESSPFEQAKYDHLLAALGGRRYGRALEIGCGSGQFTRRLAGVAGHVLAVDIAPAAVDRARAAVRAGSVEFRAADVMAMDLTGGGSWDLVSFSETVYYLGWQYSCFDVGWLAHRLYEATAPGGHLLMADTFGELHSDWLLRPWLVRTYHDLFRNVGFRVRSEGVFRGTKNEVERKCLVTLYEKPAPGAA